MRWWLLDAHVEEPSKSLNFRALGKSERILYIDAKISDGAFNLGMPEQNLNGAQVASLFVNDGRFGSAQPRMAVYGGTGPRAAGPLWNGRRG
jgi:hypothetical protein